jgi:hypothetical protein
MLRRTTLKRGKPLNHISVKKLMSLEQEVNDRLALCNRAGGTPYCHTKTISISGKPYNQTVMTCYNGTCEICGQRADVLSPHEKRHRSLGGKLSTQNSIMSCDECHRKHQNDAKSPYNDVRK